MMKLHLIPTGLVGLILTTACAHEHTLPLTPPRLTEAPAGLGAGSITTPETLRPCDGHDLPFLIALQGAKYNVDFPRLQRLPVLVVDPLTAPVTLSRTQWINTTDKNWTDSLVVDMGAFSLGLDWLPFEPEVDGASGDVIRWRPEEPPGGFASILFVQEDNVWAYSWGSNLAALFPTDWPTFFQSEVVLHPRSQMITPIGGSVRGLDFNGGFQGAWESATTCFSPPGIAPSSEATLFYAQPGGLLYTSKATASTPPPGGSVPWGWSAGTVVELLLSTKKGEQPLIPVDSAIELVAFSYDRFSGIVMYSTSDDLSAPFMVAEVAETLNSGGEVVKLVFTNSQPLVNHAGEPLGASFTARPSGSCGIDPRLILGRRIPPRQRR